jgi:hypothetical protein
MEPEVTSGYHLINRPTCAKGAGSIWEMSDKSKRQSREH